MFTKTVAAGALGAALVGSLAACGGDSDALVIGASPTPHGEILEFVQEELAADAGVEFEIKQFNDYSQPNPALDAGDVDANFFQHVPFLDEYNAEHDDALTPTAEVLVEPLAAYSDRVESLDQLPEGAQVAVPNDPSNQGRALQLLADNGVIELDGEADSTTTESDIVGNPKNVEIAPLDAAQLPRSLEDVDLAVINGNYALEADLSPREDSIVIEDGQDNPYANVFVVRAEDEDDEQLQALAELLTSPEVREFIEAEFPNTIPAF